MDKKQSPGPAGIRKWYVMHKSRIAFTLALVVLEIILSASGLGFIHFGNLSITILHIPAIIAAVIIGLPEGLILSVVFGVMSIMTAYTRDIGSIDALFRDPTIALVPRLLIPIAAWAGYKAVCHIAEDHTVSADLITSGIAAICGSVANTFFVVLAISLFYPSVFGVNENLNARSIIVSNLIAMNVLFEIIASVAAAVLAALIKDWICSHCDSRPEHPPVSMQKTFQKWFILFMTVTFFIALVFMYRILTKQDQQNAVGSLRIKARDITRQVALSEDLIRTFDLKLGDGGYVVLLSDGIVKRAGKEQFEGKTAEELGIHTDRIPLHSLTGITINGTPGECILYKSESVYILAFLPETEIYAERNQNTSLLLLGLLIIFFAIYQSVLMIVRRNVIQKLVDIDESLAEIRRGNLDEKVNVTGNVEFAELSLGINSTVDALKETMEEISRRNQKELVFAREVQLSVLPRYDQFVSLALPFEISGNMRAAREVGGDFYDYFLIGEDKLGIVIADVAGKGIPAALFMMRAKTLVKNVVLGSQNPAEALDFANKQLCDNNETVLFVTLWLGILDFREGVLEFANAAHNPPLLLKYGKSLTYLDYKRYRRSLMLGAMEETIYRNNRISFEAGDMLFLYTDGVTEAANKNDQLYGEERLKNCVDNNKELLPQELIEAVHKDIDCFVDGAEQFDDITMVVLKMKPEEESF